MFRKILIANRGEIACRIARTARRMGIQTVAVYSKADGNALHVDAADEAVCIGEPKPANSYLSVKRLLSACRASGAEAVHPGYGFLSENADFAEQLSEAGIVFIGPGPAAMRAMGDKITAKRMAADAGLQLLPGSSDVVATVDEACAAAREIGFPAILKASGGGGGRGMRLVQSEPECRAAFEQATREAVNSFGDSRIFVEKYLRHPRHIEIQLLADCHGHVIHLGERECSVQRRHQKIIEEAPSPAICDELRTKMGNQAIALARSAGYESAGTVEFLLDDEANFYFLEMNTRLQVEHPVTEMITGLDLVEWMIRIAAGEPLQIKQEEVTFQGSAIETRICAEDPARGFLPSVGRLHRYKPPIETTSLRIDSGVSEGAEITVHYDPLMAKMITHGPTRDTAISQMLTALNEFYVRGVSHNIPFLAALIAHNRFRQGQLATDIIEAEFGTAYRASEASPAKQVALIAILGFVHHGYRTRDEAISGQMPGDRSATDRKWVVSFRGQNWVIQVHPQEGSVEVVLDDRRHLIASDWQVGDPVFRGTLDNDPICAQVARSGIRYQLYCDGAEVDACVLSARGAELLATLPPRARDETSQIILSPMPGLLTEVSVRAGDEVKAGESLLTIEAMKMENVIRAERDGRITEVTAQAGDTVAADQPLIAIE